jgi:hypothetical protein
MKGVLQVGSLVRHVGLGELGVVTGLSKSSHALTGVASVCFRVYWLSPRDGVNRSEEPACDIEKVGSAFVTSPPGS